MGLVLAIRRRGFVVRGLWSGDLWSDGGFVVRPGLVLFRKPNGVASCCCLLLAEDASRVDMQGTANGAHNGDQSRQKHGECNPT
jgi:hypothetical protein